MLKSPPENKALKAPKRTPEARRPTVEPDLDLRTLHPPLAAAELRVGALEEKAAAARARIKAVEDRLEAAKRERLTRAVESAGDAPYVDELRGLRSELDFLKDEPAAIEAAIGEGRGEGARETEAAKALARVRLRDLHGAAATDILAAGR